MSAVDWQQVVDAVPSALRAGSRKGVAYLNVFLESSRDARYRFRQAFADGRAHAPRKEETARFLEGASVTAYDSDRIDLAVADELTETGLETAAAAAAHSVRTHDHGAQSRVQVSATLASMAVTEDWPEALPQAWVAEAARALAEACLDIPGTLEADVSIRDITRRISLFDLDGVSASRKEQAVATSVRCTLVDGREIRASSGASSQEPLHVLSEADELLKILKGQAGARPVDAVWDGRSVPVVLEAGWCAGTWLHEAVGHLFEADNLATPGASPFTDGARVARDIVTIADDPNMPMGRGTLAVDDEGVNTQRTVLVAEGIVQGCLHSRHTAMLGGVSPTGNGRRQDYRCIPIPRMTNLILENGSTERTDLQESASDGLLVRAIGRAFLDADTGRFSFDVLLAHAIRGGSIGEALTGFRLCGDAGTALAGVRAVSKDFSIDPGRGDCYKRGQVVRVGAGSPSLLVDGLTVRLNPR